MAFKSRAQQPPSHILSGNLARPRWLDKLSDAIKTALDNVFGFIALWERRAICDPQPNSAQSAQVSPDLDVHVSILAVVIMEQADPVGLWEP